MKCTTWSFSSESYGLPQRMTGRVSKWLLRLGCNGFRGFAVFAFHAEPSFGLVFVLVISCKFLLPKFRPSVPEAHHFVPWLLRRFQVRCAGRGSIAKRHVTLGNTQV